MIKNLKISKFLFRNSVFILGIVFLSSCATLLTGPNQRLLIQSEPSGAQVFVGDLFIDTTPCAIHVKRNFRFSPEIELRKSGFQSQAIDLQRKFNEKAILNFVLPTWGVDILTGAIVSHAPTLNIVKLKPSKKRI